MNDLVHQPFHYAGTALPECILYTQHLDFCLGNAFKYAYRAGMKGDSAKQDLEKASWYINRYEGLCLDGQNPAVNENFIANLIIDLAKQSKYDPIRVEALKAILKCSIAPDLPRQAGLAFLKLEELEDHLTYIGVIK